VTHLADSATGSAEIGESTMASADDLNVVEISFVKSTMVAPAACSSSSKLDPSA
jgi:hypothetical protein